MARFPGMLLVICLVAYASAQPVQVDGSGTTNPSKFFWKIMEIFTSRSRRDLRMTYRAVGSGTGQKEFSQSSSGNFAQGLTTFGAGDIPMSKANYDAIVGASRSMVHVPFSLGAIAIFHSVPPAEVGNAGLKLSPCVLARIFAGTITTWDHADILADNPDLSVPAGTEIQVGHRRLGSSSTGGTTGYLNAKCSGSWTLGSGSTVAWPSRLSFTPVEGSPGMKAHIADRKYAIGYLDAGHGHERNFGEAMLQNEDGIWLTSKMAMETVDANGNNGIAAAGKSAVDAGTTPVADADWSAMNLYSKAGPNTWPIVLVSYIYLSKDWSLLSSDEAGLLKAFVDYVTNEGQSMLSDFAFNSVPAAMNFWAATTYPMITQPGGGVTDFTIESTTDAWNGQAENVISSKRNSYTMWKVDEMASQLETLTGRLDAMDQSMNDYGIVPLHGSGTTNPKTMFSKAMKLMEHWSRVPLLLTYRAVGSSTGQKEFVGQASNGWKSYNHFGAGDIPMARSRYNSLTSEMVHLPFALGAIGVFHSIPSAGVASLSLSTCLLARIFSGQITTWDHADIAAENPDLQVPAGQLIKVAHRTLGSSSTGGLAGYLNKKCPASWSLGVSSTLAWPTTAGFNAVQGSPGMKDFIRANEYSIGYLDAGHGHGISLSEVALTNAAGQTRTSKAAMALGGIASAGDRGVAVGAFPNDNTADWSDVNLYDMPGDSTWPIVLVSYMYVKKDQTQINPKTAAALQAFITMILSNNGGIIEEFGFTAPPTSLRATTETAAGTIVYPPGMTSFVWEESTTAYEGMGENVLSVKRHAFDDYERDVMMADIATLKAQIAVPSGSAGPTPAAEEEGGGDAGLIIGIIACVFSLVAIVVGTVALFKKP